MMQPATTPPMTVTPSRARGWLALTVLLVLAAGLVLGRFNPAEHSFFPRCVFHAVSGWDCPGCGGQRAVHFLLHGQFRAALQANALLIGLLPLIAWWAVNELSLALRGRRWPALFRHHRWPWVLTGLVIAFGMVRNLPGFDWLRPG